MISTKHELWKRRSLILNFAIFDLKVRYRNSVLGFSWTFLEPLLMLGILYVIFSNIFKIEIENFPLYLLLGIVMWGMFSRGTDMGLSSIMAREGILKHLYLPREILLISSTITSSIMLIFELIVFGIFMAIFQFVPPSTIIILPLVLILEFIMVLGFTFPLSVLNVRYKDVQFIWAVIIRAGFFLTPIIYRFDMLPENIQNILQYSPMVHIFTIAQDVTLYGNLPNIESVQYAILTTIIIFSVGYGIFRKFNSKIIEEL